MRVDNFALYDRGSGERDRQIPGGVRKNAQVRLPLTWSILAHEYLTVTSSQEGGDVMWLGLALSYFLLCRASELFACANGLVHLNFCLTRDYLTFFRGDVQGNIEDRTCADPVRVLLMASKNRLESRMLYDHPRARGGRGGGWQDTGRSFRSTGGAPRRTLATSRRRPPDDETYGVWGKVITRTEAVVALRMMAASAGKNPAHFALHSGRIGRATKLAAQECRVANPADRPVKVSGVFGLYERCGRRRTKDVRDPYKGRISRWR